MHLSVRRLVRDLQKSRLLVSMQLLLVLRKSIREFLLEAVKVRDATNQIQKHLYRSGGEKLGLFVGVGHDNRDANHGVRPIEN